MNGVGWFYDHPPFFERMVDAERETMFLPEKTQLAEQTSAFEQMKKELAGVKQQADKEEKDKPSLLLPEKGCPAPQQTEYKPDMPIESICSSPERQPASAKSQEDKTRSQWTPWALGHQDFGRPPCSRRQLPALPRS